MIQTDVSSIRLSNNVKRFQDHLTRGWRPLAEQGYADAQFEMGLMYKHGDSVPKDNKEAMKLFKLAAEQGHSGAQRIVNISVPWWKPWKLYGWWRFWYNRASINLDKPGARLKRETA